MGRTESLSGGCLRLSATYVFSLNPTFYHSHDYRTFLIILQSGGMCIHQKSEIAQAIISTYAHDIEWISNFFDRTTPVVLVTQPANGSEPTMKQILHNWIRVTPLLRGGRGVMHMKVSLSSNYGI